MMKAIIINQQQKATLLQAYNQMTICLNSITQQLQEQFQSAMIELDKGIYYVNIGGIKQISHHMELLHRSIDIFNKSNNIFLIENLETNQIEHIEKIQEFIEGNSGSNSLTLTKQYIKQQYLQQIIERCPQLFVLNLKSNSFDDRFKINDVDIMKLIKFRSISSLSLRFSSITDDSLQFLQTEYFSQLKQIDISGCQMITEEGIKHLRGDRFLTIKLNYINIRQEAVLSLIEMCYNLNYLEVTDCQGIKYEQLPLKIAQIYGKQNSNLKWLKATTSMGIDLYIHNLLYLTSSDHNESLTDDDLAILIGSSTDTTGLYLNCCEQLSQTSIETIISTCPKLRRLKLKLFHALNDSCIRTLVESIKSINYLDLTKCYLVTDFSLKHIAINLNDLQGLILQDCRSISDEGILQLCSIRQTIKILNLYNCKKITDESIKTISQMLAQIQSLNISYCDEVTDSSVHQLSLNSNLRSLILNYCNLTDSSISLCATRLKSLQRLEIQWCPISQQCVRYICNLNQLTYLNISYCPNVCHEDLMLLGNTLTNLKCLKIQSCQKATKESIQHISRNINGLQEIWLKECKEVDDEVIRQLSANCIGLKCIDLSWCSLITNKSLVSISYYLQNLSYLSLNGCSSITDDGIVAVADRLHRIQYLNLTLCDKLTDESVIEISKKLIKLKSLYLCEIRSLTDLSISQLSNLTNLSELHLSGCQRVTNSSIAPLITQLAHLKYFNINQCHSITVECLEMLAQRMKCLKVLQVSELNVSDNFLKIAANNLHKLAFINLSSCQNITDGPLINLFESISSLIRLDIQGTNISDNTRKTIFHSITLRKLHKVVTV